MPEFQEFNDLTDFQIYLDDLLLDVDIPNSDLLAPSTSPISTPRPRDLPTTATHDYALAVPIDLWQRLKHVAPYRGIKSFVLEAIEDKLRQPHLPGLITAAKALLRIAEQLLLTADNPPANADQALSELGEVLKHFD